MTGAFRALVTRQLPDGGLAPLLEAGVELVQRADDRPWTPSELAQAAPTVDAIVSVATDPISEPVLAAGAGGRLRVVANVAVGHDNIDVAAASRHGVVVCNTPGVLDETVADLAFALLLAAGRLCSEAEADLRSGRWPGWAAGQYLGQDVHGATLGLVGYGRIGQAVARRAEGFSMEVLHHTRSDTGRPGWVGELPRLLAASDFVSLHVPLTPATRHLIGPVELGLLRPSAVLVNTARGPVVDEEALAAALEEGRLFAAGLDVYEREPEVSPRLLRAPRTVLLPHIGSASRATRRAMAAMASSSALAVLNGQTPPNALNR